jgi:signal transduction histidine kinase
MLKSLDLNITSTPVNLAGHTFYALLLQDISSEKRRLALERIFFHDLLNCTTGLNGMLSLLKEGSAPGSEKHLVEMSEQASRDIIEEIQLHRHILAAENGDLKINIETVNSRKLIDDAITKTGFHEAGKDKKIFVADNSCDTDLQTDRLILQRVLINLLKNALEASLEGGNVLAGAEDSGISVKFSVKNDQVMPRVVQLQLFQRSFSTKGKGRGLGTYSIKMLTENYLKGKVTFISEPGTGTVFTVEIFKTFPG